MNNDIKTELNGLSFRGKPRSNDTNINIYGSGRLNKVLGMDRAKFDIIQDEDGHNLLRISASNEAGSLKVCHDNMRSDAWACTLTGETAAKFSDYVGKIYTDFEPSEVETPFGTFRTLFVDLDAEQNGIKPDSAATSDDDHERLIRIEKMLADITEDVNVLRRWLNAE